MKPTTYRVTRFCCTSGMCLECRAVMRGRGASRVRIVHISGLTKERANHVAANWQSYGAKVEEDPE